MSKVFYFAVKDGCVDTRTGEKSESGLKATFGDCVSPEEAKAVLEAQIPQFVDRLRPITEEEYNRDYEDAFEESLDGGGEE